jgi:hypothetical protein
MTMKRSLASHTLFCLTLIALSQAFAGKPEVVHVRVSCTEMRICDFSVTLEHGDEGWDHYADRWEVLGPDGEPLAIRTLLHPHVHEQPFTRSLGGVAIPEGVEKVTIRGHDSVHGYGAKTAEVTLPSQ